MAFSPPSDFTEDPDGAPWSKIFLFGGGGCLLFIIVLGLMMTYGTCGPSGGCCDNIESTQRQTMAPIETFLAATGNGDNAAAYALMSPRYQEAHDIEAFNAFIDSHGDLLEGGAPRFIGTSKPGRPGSLTLTVQLLEGTTQKGVATFVLVPHKETGSRLYDIDSITKGTPKHRSERDAITSLIELHVALLGREEYEAAYRHFDATSDNDPAAYTAFARSQRALFEGTTPTIKDLTVKHPYAELTVELVKRERGSADPAPRSVGTVTYELILGDDGVWRITGVRDAQTTMEPFEPLDPVNEDAKDAATGAPP